MNRYDRRRRRRRSGFQSFLNGVIAFLLLLIILLVAYALYLSGAFDGRLGGSGSGPVTAAEVTETLTEAETTKAAETTAAETTKAAETKAPETEKALDVDKDAWNLILVGKDHPIPDDFKVPELTELRNNNSVDSRIYPSLQKMFDDMRAEGLMPYITSSYRTREDQEKIMADKIAAYKAEGMSSSEAKAEAKKWVAVPGTSEHQLGLAVDISVAAENKEKQNPTLVWQWLDEHCTEYGFIQRYPEDKVSITGIDNEPWHYRYVGEKAAKEMKEKNLCLEEYVGAN